MLSKYRSIKILIILKLFLKEKQTPTKGHPVFVAQYATATCCRECIRKWHKIQPGKELSRIQQDYLVDVIMTWIQSEVDRYNN